MTTDTQTTRPADLLRVAEEIYQQRPSWVTFFREILGAEGIVRRTLTDPDQLANFERSAEYHQIQTRLAELRARDADLPGGPREPTRVITVRLPKSLHESLRGEAHQRRTSMNRLCIAKLLQQIGPDLVGSKVSKG